MYSAHHIVQASNISFIDFIVKCKGACSKRHLVRQMGRDPDFITGSLLSGQCWHYTGEKQEECKSLPAL